MTDDIVRNACHVFLNASVGEYARRTNRWSREPKDTNLLQCAVLAAGDRALEVLRSAYRPGRAGETLETSGMRLTWEGYLKVGVHPVQARERELPIVVRLSACNSGDANELLGHPLNVAVMFAKFLNDQQSARICVNAYTQIARVLEAGVPHTNSDTKENIWDQESLYRHDDRYRAFGFWSHSWACPDPRKHGLGDVLINTGDDKSLFMAYPLISWYSENAAQLLMRHSYGGGATAVENLARVMQITNLPHAAQVLAVAATKCLKDRWEDSRPNYEMLVMLLRLIPAADAAEYLAKANGAKATLNICLSRATKEQMGDGLSALAQRGDWIRHLSGFYGRAPTVTELCGLRAKRLVDVLYFMPSVILREVLEEDDAAERLRARLLREVQTADPTMLRGALTDHDKRAKLVPYPLLSAPKPFGIGNTKEDEWDAVYGELATRYSMAVALRSRLTELIPDEMIRTAAVLAASDSDPDQPILKVLQTTPNWEEAQTLISGFAVLFKPLLAEETA